MIKLYSLHCPKCKVIEKKLINSNIKFEIIDDEDTVLNFAKQHDIAFLPALELDDGSVLEFKDINKFISSNGE